MAGTITLMGLGMPGELASAVADGVFTGTVTPTGQVVATAAGVRTKQAIDNVTDALPTQAEMVTAFGAAATTGSGFLGVIKDANADTNFFICMSNGTSYYALKMTKGA
jgi:hypothetical protein